MQIKPVFVIHGFDLAPLRGQWKLDGTGADGKSVEMVGQSIEVAGRPVLRMIDHSFGAS
jgi:hypothetical protein